METMIKTLKMGVMNLSLMIKTLMLKMIMNMWMMIKMLKMITKPPSWP